MEKGVHKRSKSKDLATRFFCYGNILLVLSDDEGSDDAEDKKKLLKLQVPNVMAKRPKDLTLNK